MKAFYRVAPLFAALFIATTGCGLAQNLGSGASATDTPSLADRNAVQSPTSTPKSQGNMLAVTYKDALGDCISNADGSAKACSPTGLDIAAVMITRADPTGPVTITLELAGKGIAELRAANLWALSYAFDLDRNIATGERQVYPTQHHMGPELTVTYGESNGSPRQIVKRYSASGSESNADANLATWKFPDDNHIEVVVASSLIPVTNFYVVGDIATSDLYDHFIENGYLAFPEGEAHREEFAQPKASATAQQTATRSASTSSAGIIAKAVMAKSTKGLNAPVGITNVFPPGQNAVHAVVQTANAPKGTKIKANWLALDTGSAAKNTPLGNYEISVYGTMYVDFSYQSGGKGMSAGSYRVELYANGNLDRNLDFTVASEGTKLSATPTPKAVAIGSCPALNESLQSSGIVEKITTSTGTKGATLEPSNPTHTFTPSSEFHAVVAIKNAPANTKVTALWFATDVGDDAPCNANVAEPAELVTQGSRNLDFNVRPPSRWSPGMYRVDIYVNDTLDSVATFTVK